MKVCDCAIIKTYDYVFMYQTIKIIFFFFLYNNYQLSNKIAKQYYQLIKMIRLYLWFGEREKSQFTTSLHRDFFKKECTCYNYQN